ncbi:MAG: hypothetical protein KF826_03450 [Xanthobacteraceae bacterium]|nr:hypothetical protein [Xanthobacteraceae bacterium]
MSDAAYIADAAVLSKELTRMKARGPGDTENAMRLIEREYGIDYGFLWSLRYRVDRLKFISHSVYLRIQAAYRAECERQVRKLQHELEINKAMGAGADAVASAEAFLNEMDAEDLK